MPRLSPLARTARRPTPDGWGDDEPMTLIELIAIFYPDGPLIIATLRAEIRQGRLSPAKVGNKFYVTPAQVRSLFEVAQCPAAQKARASISAGLVPTAVRKPFGSSATDRLRSAQAAAGLALTTPSGVSPTI